MNILLVTTTYPTPLLPRQGAFNHVLVEALRAGHDVRVIAPTPWTKFLRRRPAKPKGAPGHSTIVRADETDPVQACFPIYFFPPKIMRAASHHFYWHSIRASVHRLRHSFRPDVVLGYWLHPDGTAAGQAAKLFGVPTVLMSGGSDLRLLPENHQRAAAIAKTLQACDRLIVFSHELVGHAVRLGIEPNKIDVVYRGVDQGRFQVVEKVAARREFDIAAEDIVLLWVGRLELVKNPELLLQATVSWKRTWGTRLRVWVAGSGPLRSSLERLCQQLQISDVVEFLNDLPHHALPRRYGAADATVLTSHSEGLPNVLLESIACGTPFVATDVGGVSEIASRGIDWLVPPGNADALAQAVYELVTTVPSSERSFEPTGVPEMAARLEHVIAKVLP